MKRDDARKTDQAREGAPACTLTLAATEGPHKGRTFTFAGHDIFLVGRSKQTHFPISDGHLSRVHFFIEMNPPDCRLSDAGSRNGTFVNGQRVQTADLHDGDQIKAGHTTLLLSIVSQAPETNQGARLDWIPTLHLPDQRAFRTALKPFA